MIKSQVTKLVVESNHKGISYLKKKKTFLTQAYSYRISKILNLIRLNKNIISCTNAIDERLKDIWMSFKKKKILQPNTCPIYSKQVRPAGNGHLPRRKNKNGLSIKIWWNHFILVQFPQNPLFSLFVHEVYTDTHNVV